MTHLSRRLIVALTIAATGVLPAAASAASTDWRAKANTACSDFFTQQLKDAEALAPKPGSTPPTFKQAIAIGVRIMTKGARLSLATDDTLAAISVPADKRTVYRAMIAADRRGAHIRLKEAQALRHANNTTQADTIDKRYEARYTRTEAIFETDAKKLDLTACLS